MARGCAWLGVCMAGGVRGRGVCVAGGHAWQGGVCVGGTCMAGSIVCDTHAPPRHYFLNNYLILCTF